MEGCGGIIRPNAHTVYGAYQKLVVIGGCKLRAARICPDETTPVKRLCPEAGGKRRMPGAVLISSGDRSKLAIGQDRILVTPANRSDLSVWADGIAIAAADR